MQRKTLGIASVLPVWTPCRRKMLLLATPDLSAPKDKTGLWTKEW